MEQIEIPKIVDDWKPEGARTTEEFTVTLPGGSTFTNVPSKDPFIVGGGVLAPRNAQQTLLGLEPVYGDPNSVAPHFDVIKEALKFKAASLTASDEERNQAVQMLKQFYPDTPPSDPNARL